MNSTLVSNKQADYRRKYYTFNVLLISYIAIVFLFIFIQLEKQRNFVYVVNTAGKQRMLSQKVVKNIYYLKQDESSRNEIALRQTLVNFLNNHSVIVNRDGSYGISGENSKELKEKLRLLSIYIGKYEFAVRCILGDSEQCETDMQSYLNDVRDIEALFLTLMDNVVFSYQIEAAQGIRNLKVFILVNLVIVVLLIFGAGRYLFDPSYQKVIQHFKYLIDKREESQAAFYKAELSSLVNVVTKEVDEKIKIIQTNLEREDVNSEEVDQCIKSINSMMRSMTLTVDERSLTSGVKIFNVKELIEEVSQLANEKLISENVKLMVEKIDIKLFARGKRSELLQVLINNINEAVSRVDEVAEKWISISCYKEGAECVITMTDSSYNFTNGEEKNVNLSLSDSLISGKENFKHWISLKILANQSARLEYDLTSANTKFRIVLPLPGSEYQINI